MRCQVMARGNRLPLSAPLRSAFASPLRDDFPDHVAALRYPCPNMQSTILNSRLADYPLALGKTGVLLALRDGHPQFKSILAFSGGTSLQLESSPARFGDQPGPFHKAAMQYLFDRLDPAAERPTVTFRHNPELLSESVANLFEVLQPAGEMTEALTTASQTSLALINALASTHALMSLSKHRAMTHLEDDERALVSEFVLGFANAFLGEPAFFRPGRAPKIGLSTAWIHAAPKAFGSTDFALLLGSQQVKLRTAACFEVKPSVQNATMLIHGSVMERPYSISWKGRIPSYAGFEEELDSGLRLEQPLHQIVRELHANRSDTLWYGGIDNAILFKLVAPNVIDVSDPVPRCGTTVRLPRAFPGVGDTFTMTLPVGLLSAACAEPPSSDLFVPNLKKAWFNMSGKLPAASAETPFASGGGLDLPAAMSPAFNIAPPVLPISPYGPSLEMAMKCWSGIRSALELDLEGGMELRPALVPISSSSGASKLTVTLTSPLNSGRTYDGYAASWTGDSGETGIVAKVAQPAFDATQHLEFEPTSGILPTVSPKAARDIASRVYAEAGLLNSVLSGLGVAPRFRGLWIGNGLGEAPTASAFSTYLVMLLDDAGPSLTELGYTWSTLPVDMRVRIRELYDTLHKAFVVHGDVSLKHVCQSAATGKLTLIDFENGKKAAASEIAEEASSVESLLSG